MRAFVCVGAGGIDGLPKVDKRASAYVITAGTSRRWVHFKYNKRLSKFHLLKNNFLNQIIGMHWTKDFAISRRYG
jgi:hypothetical protein